MSYSSIARTSIVRNAYFTYFAHELAEKKRAAERAALTILAPSPISSLEAPQIRSLIHRCDSPGIEELSSDFSIEKAQQILQDCGYIINMKK